MNDLKVTVREPAVIVWGKEKATLEANEIMAKYKGLEFTEDQIPTAKREIASLRKVSTAINQQALDIDKELTENVKIFRDEVKVVKAIVDDGIKFVDKQVKEFEAKVKNAKKDEILALDEWIAVAKIYGKFNDKWLGKGITIKSIIRDLEDVKFNYDNNVKTIKMLASSHNMQWDVYIERLKTKPLDEVLERIVSDAETIKKNKVEPDVFTQKVEVKKPEVKPENFMPNQTITRKLTGTKEQLTKLNEYAIELGIGWSR